MPVSIEYGHLGLPIIETTIKRCTRNTTVALVLRVSLETIRNGERLEQPRVQAMLTQKIGKYLTMITLAWKTIPRWNASSLCSGILVSYSSLCTRLYCFLEGMLGPTSSDYARPVQLKHQSTYYHSILFLSCKIFNEKINKIII